jgi:hypothetical protein
MKQILLAVVLFTLGSPLLSQTNIAFEDFETTPSSPSFGFSVSGGAYYSGNTSGGANPSNSPQFSSGSRGYGVTDGTATLTSGSINTLGHNFVTLRLRVMAVATSPFFGLGGLDDEDFVRVEISTDNGTNWRNTAEVRGETNNSGAVWAYSATGLATTSYDGDNTAAIFAPSGGGLRSNDGYSTITINFVPNAANLRVRITLDNGGGFTPERWVIDQVRLVGTAMGPLPVKFSGIRASEKTNGVQIDWTSYYEDNVSHYLVERSTNGSEFSAIGTVDATGASDKIEYNFFDAVPVDGVSFYRIRNIDLDGKSGYSNVVKMELGSQSSHIGLYPNPVTNGQVSIQSPSLNRGRYTVTVMNMMGQPVLQTSFEHQGGAITQPVQVPNLGRGMYTIQMNTDESRIFSRTVVIN